MNYVFDFNQVHATRPWDSPYGSPFDKQGRDRRQKVADQRDIDECLECPKPECTNCKRFACYRYGYVHQKA